MKTVQGIIKRSYPNQGILLLDVGGETVMAKGAYRHLYPMDEVILEGDYQNRKGLGSLFCFSSYREMEHIYRLAKWLKISLGLPDETIARALVYKNGIEAVWEGIEKREQFLQFLLQLEAAGLAFAEIGKLEGTYQFSIDRLFENPYQVLSMSGLSYRKLQEVLFRCNLEKHDATKGQYTLEQLMKRAIQQGHFYLPLQTVEKAFHEQKLQLKNVPFGDRFLVIESRVYEKQFYEMEQRIALGILERIGRTEREDRVQVVQKWEEEKGFTLAKNQKEAAYMALCERISIVTGGPGVGKTTVCKCIADLLGEGKEILIAAPTGRAAKRAAESTGLPALTIHKLLEYNGVRFNRNEHNPIETDVLVIDESSMVDALLMDALLKAVPLRTQILFVGDVDQLPSVGPGEILRDMIESGVVPVTRLTEVFRQAADSPIITCAYAVNEGKLPVLASSEDLRYLMEEGDAGVAEQTIRIASVLYKEHSLFDVQILIPMYAGEAGIDEINRRIQEIINPGAGDLRAGDKIIATSNDSSKGVSNGDVGIILRTGDEGVSVRFQGEEKPIAFTKEERGGLQLAYAVTVHRAQGSEYPYCVIPVAKGYKGMLQKNLFYTAITRVKKKLWVVFDEEALGATVRKESVPVRNTSIRWMLKEKAGNRSAV